MEFYTDVKVYGKTVLYSGYRDGKRFNERVLHRPSLYVRANKEEGYRTIFNENLSKIDFGDINDAKEFIKKYKDTVNFKLYGNDKWETNFISTAFPADKVEYNLSDISISGIDIETTTEYGNINILDTPEEILLITVRNNKHGTITFGSRPYSGKNKEIYQYCHNEASLLKRFLEYWSHYYPDILTSWNGDTFDIPYLIRRMRNVLGGDFYKQLSPWGMVFERTVMNNNHECLIYDIYGIQQLDYLALYKKFRLIPRENYKLDTIAYCELKSNKLKNPGNSFKSFYTDYWELFCDYNIRDVDLIFDLEAKLKLIEVALTMAYSSHVNYSDVFSPVRVWESIINSYLLQQDIIQPLTNGEKISSSFPGAYVKEPVPGRKGWTSSFDATSLYPSIIMGWNISPETLVEEEPLKVTPTSILHKEHTFTASNCITANGYQYLSYKRGFLPALMRKFFNDRVKYKNVMLDAKKELETCADNNRKKELEKIASANRNQEQAIKILLNAGYGAFTNAHFKFFDIRIGTSITLTGQCIIQWCEKSFNDYFNKLLKTENKDYVTYCDTDSNYVDFQPLVDLCCKDKTDEQIVNFIDTVCQTKMKSLLDKRFNEFGEYTNAFENTINFKRENICSSGIWIGKKKYLLRVHDSEGVRYAKPEIKVTGLEIVRSSTPEIVRKGLTDCVEYMLNDDIVGLRKHTTELKNKFIESEPDAIAFPRGVKDIEKWHSGGVRYKSGCPIAVRSAILYNHYINDKKLTNKYAKINSGDKIKFLYLLKRNPIQENVIGFNSDFPVEVVERKYIDYNLQWDKAFIAPLTSLLDAINLELEPKKTLDEWFS